VKEEEERDENGKLEKEYKKGKDEIEGDRLAEK
jgi:hypothetical protein